MRLAVAAHTMSDQATVRKEMVERKVVRREPYERSLGANSRNGLLAKVS